MNVFELTPCLTFGNLFVYSTQMIVSFNWLISVLREVRLHKVVFVRK